jgi:glutamate/tyrosine decarboxylase-like PLP-dependent enzyme
MEEEAEKLMAENISKNFIDYEEYPQSAELCVSKLTCFNDGDHLLYVLTVIFA